MFGEPGDVPPSLRDPETVGRSRLEAPELFPTWLGLSRRGETNLDPSRLAAQIFPQLQCNQPSHVRDVANLFELISSSIARVPRIDMSLIGEKLSSDLQNFQTLGWTCR